MRDGWRPCQRDEVQQMIEAFRYCPECGSLREFAQLHPDAGSCPDARDGTCPEWLCAACGTGVFVALVPLDRVA